MRLLLFVPLTLALALTTACADGGGESESDSGTDTATGGEAIDEAMVVAEVLAFDQGGFVKVNKAPLATQHAASTVDIWVPTAVADLYYQIDPADPEAAQVSFPAGAILIKRHFDDGGAGDGFTVMVKGPAGYDPDALGWWWARILDDGSFAQNNGADLKGNIDFCVGCHMPSSATDYVRGIDPAEHAG